MLAFSESAVSRVPTRETWSETATGAATQAERLPALADEALGERYRAWQGASGRRYIFSVFDPSVCPAYRDAILIVVARDDEGPTRPLALIDTGPFPEPLIARLARTYAEAIGRREFHLHLLANSAAERKAVLNDLGARS